MQNSKRLKKIALGTGMIFLFIGVILLVGCSTNPDALSPGNGLPVTANGYLDPVTFFSNGNFTGFAWGPGTVCNTNYNPTTTTTFQVWNGVTMICNFKDSTNTVNGHASMSFGVTNGFPTPTAPAYWGGGAAAFVNPNWCLPAPTPSKSNYSGGPYTMCTFSAKTNSTTLCAPAFGAMNIAAVPVTLTNNWQPVTLNLPQSSFLNVDTLFYIGFAYDTTISPCTVFVGDVAFQ